MADYLGALNANGARGDDRINDDLNNGINGAIRNDTLNGAGGNDFLTRGAGSDLLKGGLGADAMREEAATISSQGKMSLGGDTAFADQLLGSDSADLLIGSVHDTIRGFGGDDDVRITAAAAVADGKRHRPSEPWNGAPLRWQPSSGLNCTACPLRNGRR